MKRKNYFHTYPKIQQVLEHISTESKLFASYTITVYNLLFRNVTQSSSEGCLYLFTGTDQLKLIVMVCMCLLGEFTVFLVTGAYRAVN